MISIDFRSRIPLYQQLIENVEALAARGLLAPDSQLPSVRALAMELSINPNTIQRAYTELERRGVIYSLPGRGSFIGQSRESLLAAKREALLGQIDTLVREAVHLGVSADDLLALCRRAIQKAAGQPPAAAGREAARTEQAAALPENRPGEGSGEA